MIKNTLLNIFMGFFCFILFKQPQKINGIKKLKKIIDFSCYKIFSSPKAQLYTGNFKLQWKLQKNAFFNSEFCFQLLRALQKRWHYCSHCCSRPNIGLSSPSMTHHQLHRLAAPQVIKWTKIFCSIFIFCDCLRSRNLKTPIKKLNS